MSIMDQDEYGDIADEDLFQIEALQSQLSQTLPLLPRPSKHQLSDDEISEDERPRRRRKSRASTTEDGGSGVEDAKKKEKKPKYKIITSVQPAPKAKIIGATQAEQLPDSSPYRIRGPIYMKPRPEPEPYSPPLQRQSFVQPRPQQSRVSSLPAQRPAPLRVIQQLRRQSPPRPDIEDEFGLDDLPSDAFSSPEKPTAAREPILIGSSPLEPSQLPRQRLVAPTKGLRQMDLFGQRAPDEQTPTQSQAQARTSQPKPKKAHNFIKDMPLEEPTHHALNEDALQTWIYPTNLGAIRDYQYSIVHNGLFNNLLVALPTGLGKTFIAATIMLNFFRWTKDAQIVFVAPTKPLVAQQVDACFKIVGIPKSQTTMLTGEQKTDLRAEEWESKRVFFMTPQTLHNDLSSGIASPKKICLLVVDEAHRATGHYSYVKVVEFLRRFNKSFRILALTATPGASVEAVQEVIDNLEISKVEIRTEESMDIQQFVHRRDIDQILTDPSDEMIMIKELFSKALQPLVNQLNSHAQYWVKDPMALTPFGLMQARKSWFTSTAGKGASQGLKGMINGLFAVLASVAHSIKLLNFHGIGPFYSSIRDFKQGVEDSNKPSKYRNQILEHQDFKKMMNMIQAWISKDDFVGHPKLTHLCDTILNHFLDAGEGRLGADAPPSSTRVIVFSEFRDSAEDIVRILNRHGPMIRATAFVGQADSKRSEGMNQAKQQETISKFKSGKFNVIVATSIGEEGLDIGSVDLIVCYDASGSPIRMLQRMGRTGRKRAGQIVLLLMRGKEEESFAKAKDNYEQMQKMITSGERFSFRHDLSVRILPRGIKPVVDKKMIEIPIENTQDPSLPEPKRRATKARKKREKVFHMPDGVQTGFTKASKVGMDEATLTQFGVTVEKKKEEIPLQPIPSVDSVLLTPEEEQELVRKYQNIEGDDVQEVMLPDMTAQPVAQRSLRPIGNISHGEYTNRYVKLFKTLSRLQSKEEQYHLPYGEVEPSLDYLNPLVQAIGSGPNRPPRKSKSPAPRPKKAPAPKKPKVAPKPKPAKKQSRAAAFLAAVDLDSDEDEISGPASSEGEGDDLMRSEEISEDGDDGGSSLRDFIAASSSQAIVRSSTSPPPPRRSDGWEGEEESEDEMTPKGKGKRVQGLIAIHSDEENGEEEEFPPDFSKPSVGEGFDSDDIVAPVPTRVRREKRMVVEDSDSDE